VIQLIPNVVWIASLHKSPNDLPYFSSCGRDFKAPLTKDLEVVKIMK
jgi:hypothetical protein